MPHHQSTKSSPYTSQLTVRQQRCHTVQLEVPLPARIHRQAVARTQHLERGRRVGLHHNHAVAGSVAQVRGGQGVVSTQDGAEHSGVPTARHKGVRRQQLTVRATAQARPLQEDGVDGSGGPGRLQTKATRGKKNKTNGTQAKCGTDSSDSCTLNI